MGHDSEANTRKIPVSALWIMRQERRKYVTSSMHLIGQCWDQKEEKIEEDTVGQIGGFSYTAPTWAWDKWKGSRYASAKYLTLPDVRTGEFLR